MCVRGRGEVDRESESAGLLWEGVTNTLYLQTNNSRNRLGESQISLLEKKKGYIFLRTKEKWVFKIEPNIQSGYSLCGE